MPESSQKSDQKRVLTRYATRVLSGRPCFRAVLRAKLFTKAESLDFEDPSEIIDSILADLAESGYLDDKYLAEAYVRRQLSKCYGPKIIALKLKYLGLPREMISEVLRSEAGEEAEKTSIQKFWAKYPRLDTRRVVSKLYSRGYSGLLIKQVFDGDWIED